MSETYTPGPWSWEFSRIGDRRIALSNHQGQDVMISTTDIDDHALIDVGEANARLIAAAPDLLQACESVEQYKLVSHDDIIIPKRVWENAQRALAKVRGEPVRGNFVAPSSARMADIFSYSSDEEHYDGEFESREAAVEAAKAEGLKRFWTGQNRPPEVRGNISADWLLDQILMQEDFSIDAAEGWPGHTREQEDDLTERLRETFQAWMTKHNLTPTFWLVEDVQEHSE